MHEVVPEKMGAGELILYWVLEIIRFIPRFIVQTIFHFAAKPYFDPTDKRVSAVESVFRENVAIDYKISPLDITLPDGRCVKATFYEDPRSGKDTPTVIYFPGLGELQSDVSAKRVASADHPTNMITFDYAGTGANHEWGISRANTLLMSLSIYGHLTQNLGISRENIHFLGFSLGGAYALDLHRTLPDHEGIIVCDRTFSDLYAILSERLGGFLGFIAYIFLWIIGEDLPSKETIAALPQGKVHVLNLPEHKDDAIPYAYDLLQNLIPNPDISLSAHRLTPIAADMANHRTPLSELMIGNQTAARYLSHAIHE